MKLNFKSQKYIQNGPQKEEAVEALVLVSSRGHIEPFGNKNCPRFWPEKAENLLEHQQMSN